MSNKEWTNFWYKDLFLVLKTKGKVKQNVLLLLYHFIEHNLGVSLTSSLQGICLLYNGFSGWLHGVVLNCVYTYKYLFVSGIKKYVTDLFCICSLTCSMLYTVRYSEVKVILLRTCCWIYNNFVMCFDNT